MRSTILLASYLALSLHSATALGVGRRAARSLRKSAKPVKGALLDGEDPECKTGLISLVHPKEERQVCCPTYCKECSDYPTCSSPFGKDTKDATDACCVSSMLELSCEKKAMPCLKSCTESLPPCIMPAGEVYEMPDPEARNARTDCEEVVDETATALDAAVAGSPGATDAEPAAKSALVESGTEVKPKHHHKKK